MSEVQMGMEKNPKQEINIKDIIQKAPPIQTGHFVVRHGWLTRFADSLNSLKKKK